MGRVVFITFGDKKFEAGLNRILLEAKQSRFFDDYIGYTPKDFEPQYWSKYHSFYEQNPRGYGYWIWKSYFIRRTLGNLKNEDILVYLDAGCEINKFGFLKFRKYLKLVKTCSSGLVVFHNGYIERQWTKGDIIDFFHVRDIKGILDSEQIMGGVLILRNCKQSRCIIQKWYDVIHNFPPLVTDSPSKVLNYPDFIENRHDQSVFSILCKLQKDVTILPVDEVDPGFWHSQYWHNIQYLSHPIITSRCLDGSSRYSYSFFNLITIISKAVSDFLRVKLGGLRFLLVK